MSNASKAMPRAPRFSAWMARRAETVMMTTIGIGLASKFALAFRINVHWDEFYFLSTVHEHVRGELSAALQTFHVHLFSWLTQVDGEANQIIVGRLVMAVLATGTGLAIYGIARRFAPRGAASFAMLGYLALSVVVDHGASFRADPNATFLTMLALYLVICRAGNTACASAAGAALALATLVTIKVVFFLPLVAMSIWCLVPGFRSQARIALASGGTFLLTGALLYRLHVSGLAPVEQEVVGQLQSVAEKVLLEDGIFIRWADFLFVVAFNPLFWILIGEAAIFVCSTARTGKRRADWLPLALLLPVLTAIFYRNAFLYYYPLILAPAAVLLAFLYEKHRLRAIAAGGVRGAATVGVLILAQCAFLGLHVARAMPDEITPQRRVLAAIHAIFPQPVPYIGGYGVVASFPRQGFFMSTWGTDNYRRAGVPIFPALVTTSQAPMLLADSAPLYGAVMPGVSVKEERSLLPEDAEFLKANYIPHWGMIFVAGKQVALPAAGETVAFDIVVSGDYRLEAKEPVTLDGGRLRPGEVTRLTAGTHELASDEPATVSLRWAAALPAPDESPVDLLTFFGVR